MTKSPDAFRTISEVADWLGTPTHVLRFWESRFAQVKPVKRAGGRRYYRPADMALLGGIKKLLHDDGMTIRGVQKILREQGVKHVAAMSQPLDLEEAPFAEDAIEATPVDNVVPMTPRGAAEAEAEVAGAEGPADAAAPPVSPTPPAAQAEPNTADEPREPAVGAEAATEEPAEPVFEHARSATPHSAATSAPEDTAPPVRESEPDRPALEPTLHLSVPPATSDETDKTGEIQTEVPAAGQSSKHVVLPEPRPEPEPGPNLARDVMARLTDGTRPDPAALRPLFKRLALVRQHMVDGQSQPPVG